MKVRSLGWRTDLMMLTLQGSIVTDHGSRLVVRTPSNPAFRWGHFILHQHQPRRGDAERWVAEFETEFPEAKHLAFGVDGTEGETGEVEELASLGVTPELSTVMTASAVREPPRPNREAVYRPLVSDADWAAAVDVAAANQESDDAKDYRRFETTRMRARRALAESGRGAWFGAFADGQMLAGLGIFTDGSGIARFQSVNTVPSARGRGLAGTAAYHAARYGLDELGARTLVIIADPDYVAARVYRSIGFAHAETQLQFEREPPH